VALLVCTLAAVSIARAQEAKVAPPSGGRPKVGLVLAGGGAKGGAHVGVLKVLEELNVPIDCIAGTSMGALVGAGYASGIPAASLESFLNSIDWQTVIGGQGRRDLEPIEEKRAGVTYSNRIEMGIGDNGLIVPSGLVNTSSIENLLRTFVATARLESSFDRLPIPFRAVATDMITGNMVVLDRGDLATAMRASMAIPGAFAPVETDQYVLSDGGLVRNIPVDIARELCAEVVIVVNLVELPIDRSKVRSATQLLSRTMDVMIIANENLQLESLGPRDIRIDVPMGDITTGDFERLPETVPLGEAAARKQDSRLRSLAVPKQEYVAWREAITASQHIEARLADVQYEGLKRVNPQYLKQQAQVHAGDTVDTTTISEEARRMTALPEFETVGYRLDGGASSPTLVWLPREKQWGPDYLRLDLGLYASADGDLSFGLYGRHQRTWINSLGAEWRNEIQIGGDNLVSTSFYQPFDVAQRFFVEPRAFWIQSKEDVFLDGDRLARYEFADLGGQVDLGVNFGRHAQARLGYIYTRRNVDTEIGSPLLPEVEVDDAGLAVSAVYDTRDTAFSPTRGAAVQLEYYRSDDSLGGDRTWDRGEMGVGMAIPVRSDVVWVTLAGGTDFGNPLPPDRAFGLGGPGSFPGFELGELRTGEYWTAAGSYLWKVKDLQAIQGQALYAGLRLQVGEAGDRVDLIDAETIYGASVYLSGRTLVGPLTVGLGTTNADSWSLWLAVGRPVGTGTILERGIFR
jgi:NTE family protein